MNTIESDSYLLFPFQCGLITHSVVVVAVSSEKSTPDVEVHVSTCQLALQLEQSAKMC